jgi:ABC-type multidrug transport system fused ATPase/permease subunit
MFANYAEAMGIGTQGGGGDSDRGSVVMKDFDGRWNPKANENTLSNINIYIEPGELLCIIGHTASGKVW